MPEPPPPVEQCEWEWLGVMPWEWILSGCQSGTECDPPAEPGAFIGQTAFTDCTGHD